MLILYHLASVFPCFILFLWDVRGHSYWVPLYIMCLPYSPDCFKIFRFIFGFQSFDYDFLGEILCNFILHGIYWQFCKEVIWSLFKMYAIIITKVYFSTNLTLFFICNSNHINACWSSWYLTYLWFAFLSSVFFLCTSDCIL